MKKVWQRLLLIMIILSCGIIFSIGSDAGEEGADSKAATEKEGEAAARKIVVYAQDRHAPW